MGGGGTGHAAGARAVTVYGPVRDLPVGAATEVRNRMTVCAPRGWCPLPRNRIAVYGGRPLPRNRIVVYGPRAGWCVVPRNRSAADGPRALPRNRIMARGPRGRRTVVSAHG